MSVEEQLARANRYISQCVVHGAEDLKKMLGLDKQPVLLEVGHRASRQPKFTRTTPKYQSLD